MHRRPAVCLGVVLCLWNGWTGGAAEAAGLEQSGASRAVPFHLLEARIDDARRAIESGQITCRQLVQLYLNRIAAYDKTGPNLNALQTVNPRALEEADALDVSYKVSRAAGAAGPVGPLHCVPVLVKDQIEARDMPTTYGSALFKDFIPARDATVVTRLKKAGALILGKTTMGEFAARYVSSAGGIVRNPYDPTRTASGSSGGTGSGVASSLALVGIGEDTGGSIRGPASVASLVGLRPTVALVSRFGMMPSSPSSDTVGPITRTVGDAALLLDVIAGYDPDDPMTAYAVGQTQPAYTAFLLTDGLKGARIGVIRDPMDPRTDTASEDYRKVRTVIDRALADLRRLGAEVIDPVTIPDLKDRIKKAYENNQFEAERAINKYLAGHSNAPVKTLREILISGKVVPWRAISLINNVGRSPDEAGYLQVLQAREELRQIVLKLLADERLDALVYATFDHQPTLIADDVMTNPHTRDAHTLGNNRYLSPALGFPAIVVPAGFTSDSLPVGIEFLARAFSEGLLLKLAYAYEQATLHRRPPPTTPALPKEP
jgi:amidase